MPLMRAKDKRGRLGWRWGRKGKVYVGVSAKKRAIAQGIAIEGPEAVQAMLAENYNPGQPRDSRGRWSSGGGGGGGTLTSDEQKAVNYYTSVPGGVSTHKMQDLLSGAKEPSNADERLLVEHLPAAVEKMPEVRTTASRGIVVDDPSEFEPGGYIRGQAIESWSADEEVAKGYSIVFAGGDTTRSKVVMQYDGQFKDPSGVVPNPSGKELWRADTSGYVVTSAEKVKDPAGDFTVVKVRQATPRERVMGQIASAEKQLDAAKRYGFKNREAEVKTEIDALRKQLAENVSNQRKPQPPNPLRSDPSRTKTLRRAFERELNRRFSKIKGAINRLVIEEDAFGLKQSSQMGLNALELESIVENYNPNQPRDARGRWGSGGGGGASGTYTQTAGKDRGGKPDRDDVLNIVADVRDRWGYEDGSVGWAIRDEPTSNVENTRWQFHSHPEKLQRFLSWLAAQIAADIYLNASGTEAAYWTHYIQEGYRKGAGRAFDETRVLRRAEAEGARSGTEYLAWYQGTREEFLRSSFGRPETAEKVQLLASRTLTDLKNVTEDMATRMSRALVDGLVQGQNPRKIARDLNAAVDVGKNRAQVIAQTEIIRAHAEGQLDSMEALGVTDVGVAAEWSTAGDGRVCPLCRPLDGVVMKVKEARGLIPRHPRCLPGDTLVTSVSSISAASERWFDGYFIVIETASGRKLSCTPNHPVLTNRGWVPAESLDLSSKVVCDGGSEWERVIDGLDYEVPPSIHDVTKAFFSSSQVTTSPVPLSSVDFHGDGMEGQVAVIGADRRLLFHNEPPLSQSFEDIVFKRGYVRRASLDSQGVPALSFHSRRDSAGSLVRGSGLPKTGDSVHPGPFKQLGLTSSPGHDTVVLEPAIDHRSADSEFIRKLLGGFTPKIFLDNVVNVNRHSVRCHIYNLQTESGWYTANGIITHNCRCTYIPANVGEDTEKQKRTKQRIQSAIDTSIRQEIPEKSKRTLAKQKKLTRWAGADRAVSKQRPKSVLNYNPGQPRDARGRWSSGGGGGGGRSKTYSFEERFESRHGVSLREYEKRAERLFTKDAAKKFIKRAKQEVRGEGVSGKKFKTSEDWEKALNPEEKAAMVKWNKSWKKIREEDSKDSGRSRLTDTVIETVAAAPRYNGDAYRGMRLSKKQIAQLKPGKSIEFKPITSWSKNRSEAAEFSRGGKTPVLIKAKLKDGRDISAAGYDFSQYEVVSRRSSFTIKSAKYEGNTYVIEAVQE